MDDLRQSGASYDSEIRALEAVLRPLWGVLPLMACPSSAKCSVLTVEDDISVLNDPRAQSLKIFIVVNNPTDARRIAEAVKDVPKVNISNYGHLGNDLNSRTKITDTVYITEQDFEEFARIRNTGKPCQYQVVPDNQSLDMYELIKKAKNK